MLIIRGDTFPHRETLKDLGAQWDQNARQWEIRRGLSHATKTRVKGLSGVTVLDTDEDPPEPASAPQGQPQRQGETLMVGDDFTWHNHFRNQNPKVYFGFSSIDAFAKHVNSIPESKRRDSRTNAWVGGSSFSGTDDMKHAMRLISDGWQGGVENAEKIMQRIATEQPQKPKQVYNVSGGSVNVGKMLAGNPKHMRARPKQPGKKVVTVFVDNVASARVNADTIIARAATVAAVADLLERKGYSCEIVSVSCIASDDLDGNRAAHQVVVNVKQAGEKLNLANAVFTLGHPSFFRRLLFAAVENQPELRYIWFGMGFPSRSFDKSHPTAKNEIHIPIYNETVQGATIEDKAMRILEGIKIEGVTINPDH